ncbi:MAG: hypothetical protein IBX53_13465 [Halomonas sp.]|uniref:DUF3541 domain-containing protein n=1 Tax=Halomonas sp. TaxID=1486246 RepID=UPI001A04AA90|nr:hypothetical protein [Halomonas sp.]MBE0490076.1 hypothetical protein [Halomonas sp.]
MLARQVGYPLALPIRDALVEAVDADSGIIPSTEGSTDLTRGEHRNVLDSMVLRWPGTPTPEPAMSAGLL